MAEAKPPFHIVDVKIGEPHKNYYGKMQTNGLVTIRLKDDDGEEIVDGTPITESLVAMSLGDGEPVGRLAHKPIKFKNGLATYRVLVKAGSV